MTDSRLYDRGVRTVVASWREYARHLAATLEHARHRGLGTALTARHLRDALSRGCQTATLQSTPMAERVYAAVGFRDLGQVLEYVPPDAGDGSAGQL